MSRLLHLAIVGIMLMLISLILDVGFVGAKWVRMGDNEKTIGVVAACQSSVVIGVASARNSIVESGKPDEGTFTYERNWQASPLFKWIGDTSLHTFDRITGDELDSLTDASHTDFAFVTQYHSEIFTLDDHRTTKRWEFYNVNIEISTNNQYKKLIILHYDNRGRSEPPYLVVDVVPLSELQASCSEPANFTDGRTNSYDPWQPVAIYCEDKMVKVYGIDANANGYFAFAVTQADIDKLGIPKENMLLASSPSAFGGKIRLYKLKDTGELQINAPGLPPESWKEYVFTWAGCT